MAEVRHGPLENRWWLPRMLLRMAFRLFRLLDHIAPGATDLLGLNIGRVQKFQQMIRIARPDVVTMRVGEVRFRLCLVGGHEIAHRDYMSLAANGEVYEPVMTACLTRLLRRLPDPIFMDIGAFVGYFTCYVATLLQDQRPVWAVESNPDFCVAIRQSVALNRFTGVRVLQASLSDRPQTMTIADTALLPSREEGHGRRIVQAITLDELCAREAIAPTIVKIDVHGAEGKVMRGMSRLLREVVQVALVELHTLAEYQPHSPGVTRAELLEFLEQSGFSLFLVAGHRLEHRSGMGAHLDRDRFAYVPVTAVTRQLLLFDRPLEVLILASKIPDVAAVLGPSVDLASAVG